MPTPCCLGAVAGDAVVCCDGCTCDACNEERALTEALDVDEGFDFTDEDYDLELADRACDRARGR